MAAAATIEVLDNLQFQHVNTAKVYTINADSIAGESVKTTPIALPPDVSAARVIINNNYGVTGSTIVGRVRMTGLSGVAGVTTKTQNTQPLEWTSVALAGYVQSAEVDLSGLYAATLHVDVAIAGTTAHLGTEILVQIRKEATVAEWTEWARLVVLSGLTAFTVTLPSTANAGQKVIPITGPVTNHLNHNCKNIFILDATIANCEICWQSASGTD